LRSAAAKSCDLPHLSLVFGTFRTNSRNRQKTMPLGLEESRDVRQDRLGWVLGSPWLAELDGR
jgi:hypothetical protein